MVDMAIWQVAANCRNAGPKPLLAFDASSAKNYIETVWGRGYVLREPSEEDARIAA
jgi:hypothetical protein